MRARSVVAAGMMAAAVAAQQQMPNVAVAQFGQTWFGPDGPWSTIEVSIGTPPQKVYLTVATLSDTILPITPDACGDLKPCIEGRGLAYNYSDSSTWQPLTDRDAELEDNASAGVIINGEAYGQQIRGLPGMDTISVGGVPGVTGVYIGAVSTSTINNGLFGLRNITLQMYLQRVIPSPFWAYNTGFGDGYRLPQLVFGGYDQSKYTSGTMQNYSMTLLPNGMSTMRLTMDSLFLNITGPQNRQTFRTNSSLVDDPIDVIIDSSTPFSWLPRNITDRIAQSVGAVWNATIGENGAYIYNLTSPAYQNLQNATLAFHFEGPMNANKWLFNSMSVSQFLHLTAPTAGVSASSPVAYLPLMPIDNPNSYVLGRSFLQQIYLMANYHNMTFSLSQLDIDSQAPTQYVKVTAGTPPAFTTNPPTDSGKLSAGAIAGIVIGVIAAVALIVGGVLWRYRRKIKIMAPIPPEADNIYPPSVNYSQPIAYYGGELPGNKTDMRVPPIELYTPGGTSKFYSPPMEVQGDEPPPMTPMTPRAETHQHDN
ncbi:Candidapepsin-5 [Arthrobotrys entomopaga]|nr:Candidapepsin-5 [Arthrobotrys entomopaga]